MSVVSVVHPCMAACIDPFTKLKLHQVETEFRSGRKTREYQGRAGRTQRCSSNCCSKTSSICLDKSIGKWEKRRQDHAHIDGLQLTVTTLNFIFLAIAVLKYIAIYLFIYSESLFIDLFMYLFIYYQFIDTYKVSQLIHISVWNPTASWITKKNTRDDAKVDWSFFQYFYQILTTAKLWPQQPSRPGL